jgi:hypothetical protein
LGLLPPPWLVRVWMEARRMLPRAMWAWAFGRWARERKRALVVRALAQMPPQMGCLSQAVEGCLTQVGERGMHWETGW